MFLHAVNSLVNYSVELTEFAKESSSKIFHVKSEHSAHHKQFTQTSEKKSLLVNCFTN